jgi:endo-1,4-beta-mannosidase
LEPGVEPAQAKRLAGKVLAENMELRKVSDIVRVAYKVYISQLESDTEIIQNDDDLRNAAGYSEMKASGAVSNGEW